MIPVVRSGAVRNIIAILPEFSDMPLELSPDVACWPNPLPQHDINADIGETAWAVWDDIEVPF